MPDLQFNPFDFANPVTQGDSFAGRKEEKDDVRYYLSHAQNTRPIHLALTGERSAGKTSMLNMISQQAEHLGFLVVRIDLNIGDAAPDRFFQRLFDAVLMEVVRDGKYGGQTGRTWRAYRALIDAGTQTEEIPFGFPGHIAAVMGGTRILSVAVLQHDLADIQAESAKKIIVVIDECDVLSSNPDTLQILRNLFTPLDRFMFVIAGTPRLFPVFDDVFSPIVRQFKKLSIAPFEHEDETKACIVQPLERIGLDPEDVIDNVPSLVGEIHQLTGGRPYEIQLLCHVMFRRLQEGLEEALVVNLDALDAVRKDLEQGQAHNLGRLSHLFGTLSRSSLIAIQMIRRVRESTAAAALLATRLATSSWTVQTLPEDTFTEHLRELVEAGILEQDDLTYRLSGDQFDEVYLRYLAASRGISIPSFQPPVSTLIARYISDALDAPQSQYPRNPWGSMSVEQLELRLGEMLTGARTDGSFGSRDFEWAAIYRSVKRAQENREPNLPIAAISIEVDDLKVASYFFSVEDDFFARLSGDSWLKFAEQVSALGGTVGTEKLLVPLSDVSPIEEIAPRTESFRALVSDRFETDGYGAFDRKEYAASAKLFEDSFGMRPTANAAVGVAFQALHLCDWTKAIEWADKSKDAWIGKGAEYLRPLAEYDAALACIMLNDFTAARNRISPMKQSAIVIGSDITLFLLAAVKGTSGEWTLEPTELSISDAIDQLDLAITD